MNTFINKVNKLNKKIVKTMELGKQHTITAGFKEELYQEQFADKNSCCIGISLKYTTYYFDEYGILNKLPDISYKAVKIRKTENDKFTYYIQHDNVKNGRIYTVKLFQTEVIEI